MLQDQDYKIKTTSTTSPYVVLNCMPHSVSGNPNMTVCYTQKSIYQIKVTNKMKAERKSMVYHLPFILFFYIELPSPE